MCNFKTKLLDIAIKEINDKTDLIIKYEQEKKGVKVVGFRFSVKIKWTEEDVTPLPINRDLDTLDILDGQTEKEKKHRPAINRKLKKCGKKFITLYL